MAIDYYLQNLLYKMIFENSQYCKRVLDTVTVSNQYLYDLKNIFNRPYNEEEFNRLNNDTSVFKLTYKAKYKEKDNGNRTFYNYIISFYN